MVVAAILVLQVVLPPGSGGPGLSAAQEIRRLGRLSVANEPTIALGPSQYVYVQTLDWTKQAQGDLSIEYDIAVEAKTEFWIAKDGSGRRDTTLQQVNFVSELDRDNWVQLGSPPLPQVGDTDQARYAPGDLHFFTVEGLPTDPEELRRVLEKGNVIDIGDGAVNVLSSIGSLLSQENLSPELRLALFEVAATTPGISVQYDVTDPQGRPAVSITATDVSGDTKVFLDQSDGRLLAFSVDYPAGEGHAAFTEWHVYLESGIVSKIGERPT